MLCAASVRAYLQLHQATRASIFGGMHASRRTLRLEEPRCISPDLTLMAGLGPDTSVLVSNLAGEIVTTFHPPEVPAPWHPADHWGWSPCGRLAVPYGRQGITVGEAGVLFIDLQRKASTLAESQLPLPLRHFSVHFCPSKALVLLQLVTPQNSQALHILDFQGRLLAKSTQSQGSGLWGFQCEWAPSGEGIMYHGVLHTGSHVRYGYWTLSQSHAAADCLTTPLSSIPVTWRAAVPLNLAIAAQNEIFLGVPRSGCQRPTMAVQAGCLGWGACLAVLPRLDASALQGCDRLLLYVEQDAMLTLQHTLTAGDRLFAPQILEMSAHGKLCAAVTGCPRRGRLRYRHLAAVHLASGRLHEYCLLDSQLADDLACQDMSVRWNIASTAVLVSSKDGGCNEVFRFA